MEKPREKQVERADTIFLDDDQHPQKPVPIVEKIDYSELTRRPTLARLLWLRNWTFGSWYALSSTERLIDN